MSGPDGGTPYDTAKGREFQPCERGGNQDSGSINAIVQIELAGQVGSTSKFECEENPGTSYPTITESGFSDLGRLLLKRNSFMRSMRRYSF